MKKRKIFFAILLVSVFTSTAFLTSCSPQKRKYTAYSLDYFDTATTITGYEANQEDFDRISGEILSLLGGYHRLYTIYHRFDGTENLCTVNELQDGVHRVVEVDTRIVDMLLYAKEMYTITDGKMNIAMGSVLSIWHEYRTKGVNEPWAAELPSLELLYEAAQHTDINNLIIDKESSTVWIADPQMTLDVGAVGKGYAVEMVARSLEERGITGYVINVGGNVRTLGTKPDNKKWVAGIENPDTRSDKTYLAYLYLAGESVVTSGSYQRYYTVEDKSYHHIIDPETLLPAEGYISVSVVCRNSANADALSTALFCMPFEDGLALVESLPDTEAHWVMNDGTTKYSSGFLAYTAEP